MNTENKAAIKSPEKQVTTAGMLHLSVVYIVWSSTYLAIRLAVRQGAGFPPFTFGAMRTLASFILLFAWALLRRQQVKPNRKELVIMIISGILLWNGGNGMVTFASKNADSSLVALLMASMPIWVTLIESILDRKLPNRQVVIWLLLGFIGIVILTLPSFNHGVRANIIAIFSVVMACISWSSGTILQSRRPVSLSASVNSAYQMLFATVGFVIIMLLTGEPTPTPNTEAWLAYAYLVVFGTLAYISYITAVKLLPTNVVMTYAYVNPVLAVFLGWLVLREPITWWTVVGAIFVLMGISGVFRAQKMHPKK